MGDEQATDQHPGAPERPSGQPAGPAAPQPAPRSSRGVWWGIGIALVAILVLGVISMLSGVPGQPTATPVAPGGTAAPGRPAQTTAQARLAAPHRIPGDPFALGNPTAPVVIVEWADFQCPFCGAYVRDVEPALIKQYVDTGKARIEWRDYAFLGKESDAAAIAARAAARQGKFWQYHAVLFDQQGPENSGGMSPAYLLGVARQLGLDTNRFSADIADPALAEQVAADQAEGTSLGVNGTPGFVINGKLVSGAQPLPEFQKVIDAALTRSGGPTG